MQKLYFVFFLMIIGTCPLRAQVQITALNAPYIQDFNVLASSGTTNDVSTLPVGWTFFESGTNANATYAAGTGTVNTGNTYSFGNDSDRALGSLLSGSVAPTFGASFVNSTSAVITSISISYAGEQWRVGALGRGPDRLDFQYSTDATDITNGVWIDVDELDFLSVSDSPTVGAVNGNELNNRSIKTFTISGLQIESGEVFYVRWQDYNVASSDDGLAVDDFSLVGSGTVNEEPNIVFSSSSLSFEEVIVGETKTLAYEVVGSFLTDSIVVSSTNAAFTISVDGSSFLQSIKLAPVGGVVSVRFNALNEGLNNAAIEHSSDTVTRTLAVSGLVYNPLNNIISIAEARALPVGSKVTITGRVTVADELRNPAYVQDTTGGLPIFFAPFANEVEIGDSVIVTGPIGVFNDQKQISGSGITYSIVDVPLRIIVPKPILLSALASHEGQLVTVQDVRLENTAFVFYPQSTEKIIDGDVRADLRIDGDTDIPGLTKPQGEVDITGVVGRFRSSMQLLPRFQQDIPGAFLPEVPSDTTPKAKTLDVVNWNFEFFGATKEQYNEEFGPEDEALQLQNIKRVLDSLNADLVAVQEVSDEILFSELVQQLGTYKFKCSQRFSYSFEGTSNTFPPQKLCFIYDTTTVEVLSERVLFEELYDAARTTTPTAIPDYPTGDPSSFYSSGRLPYLLNTRITINGVQEEISFINIHAKSGAAEEDRLRRAYDARVLKDTLDTYFANGQVIILGDLNDDLDRSITPGKTTPYDVFVNDAPYTSISKALSDAGARSTISFGDVIDHQIISSELDSGYIEGSVQIVVPFRYIENYANTTSDHLPLISRFKLVPIEAVFDEIEVTLTEDSLAYIVTLNFSKPLTSNAELKISILGTAEYGKDFTTDAPAVEKDVTLNVNKGDTTASFSYVVVDDMVDELEENSTFIILPSQGIMGTNSLTVYLEDNDIPFVSFVEGYEAKGEGSGEHNVRITLSIPPASDQHITVKTYTLPWVIYGKDFTTEPSGAWREFELLIPAGSSEVTFTVTPLADGKKELPVEPVTFYLAETSPGLKTKAPFVTLFGIIDVRQTKGLYAYPNPTVDIIALGSHGDTKEEIIELEILNNLGDRIYKGKGTIDELNRSILNIFTEQGKGLYMLKTKSGNHSHVIRVVKN